MRSAVEEEKTDVCNRMVMTRSAYNRKKFDDRRMTRSAFLELQKQQPRQGAGKPQQQQRWRLWYTMKKKKKKKSEPVIPLTWRQRQYRDFTPEERQAYTKKLGESEGFDVGKLPSDIVISNAIREIPLSREITVECTASAKRALGGYNKENHTKYQFVKLIRVCFGPAVGSMYYITFEAEQDGIYRNFQAQVRDFIGTHIKFCREEKKPNLTEGPGETSQQL